MAVKKKKAPRWQFTYNDKDYTLDVGRDFTFARMRQVKSWFPQLGSVNQMVIGLVNGDPEAWACAVWCARKSAGEADVQEPNRMRDFNLWELMADEDIDEGDEEQEGDGEERPTSSPTHDSTMTSTSSEGDTSDS